MLKKLCLIFLIVPAITHAAQQLEQTNKKLTLDVVTTIQPLQAIILGYLNMWDEERVHDIRADSSISFKSDSRYFVAVHVDGTLHIYKTQTGKHMYALQGEKHTNQTCVRYSPHGNFIASGSYDQTIKIWDAYELVHTIDAQMAIQDLVFSPDNSHIAAAGLSGTIKVWDTKEFRLQRSIRCHAANILSITYSPNSKQLATRSSDNTVKIHDAALTSKSCKTLNVSKTFASQVVYSPDSNYIATTAANKITIWDTQNFELVCELCTDLEEYKHLTKLIFSPDNTLLIAFSTSNYNLCIWNIEKRQLIHKMPTVAANNLTLSPNGVYLMLTGYEKTQVFKNPAIEIRLADSEKENIDKK